MNFEQAWQRADYDAIAAQIDCGTDQPDTTRALIIFNHSGEPLTGVAVFHVSMPWREGRPLPPVTISHYLTGDICASEIIGLEFNPSPTLDEKGTLRFDIRFQVRDVPPHGWDTCIAAYSEITAVAELNGPLIDESRYAIRETLRHSGQLPPQYAFAAPPPLRLENAVPRILALASGNDCRLIIGIAGPPAAGKSTLAERLVGEINAASPALSAMAAPMDGFHLPNPILEERGIRHLKGAPQTFDATGFVAALRRLRDEPNMAHPWPIYDRVIHSPVENALTIGPEHRVIIVEGNYLLLEAELWNEVKAMLNEAWFIDVPDSTAESRLIHRHVDGGRSREEAIAKIASTDEPNAAIILASKPRADFLLTVD